LTHIGTVTTEIKLKYNIFFSIKKSTSLHTHTHALISWKIVLFQKTSDRVPYVGNHTYLLCYGILTNIFCWKYNIRGNYRSKKKEPLCDVILYSHLERKKMLSIISLNKPVYTTVTLLRKHTFRQSWVKRNGSNRVSLHPHETHTELWSFIIFYSCFSIQGGGQVAFSQNNNITTDFYWNKII